MIVTSDLQRPNEAQLAAHAAAVQAAQEAKERAEQEAQERATRERLVRRSVMSPAPAVNRPHYSSLLPSCYEVPL